MKTRLQLIRMVMFTSFMRVVMATHSPTVSTMALLGRPQPSKIVKEVIVGIRTW
ncbi:MAG: Uncharacterised protein [Euryarchaeota archaeon UBA443]|nr:MAG: Uncharacterised protein [Euryarchaeota archaeon UBA443]